MGDTSWISSAACASAEEIFFPAQIRVTRSSRVRPRDGTAVLMAGVPLADGGCAGCRAAARVKSPMVMCDNHPDADRLERAREAEAKQICASCPVVEDCLSDAMAEPHQPPGTFGGLNRWERMWLTAIPREDLDALDELANTLTAQECIELREMFEEVGPPAPTLRGPLPNEIAARHGVALSVAERWVDAAGPARRGRTALTEAMLRSLGAGEWVERRVVEAVGQEAVPEERATKKAEKLDITEDRARQLIAIRSLDDRKCHDTVEERCIKGVPYLRLLPRPAPANVVEKLELAEVG